ncbi:RlpA-like double-psi beta-barrel-containing domain containing protein [Russula decolorans]
MLPPSFDVIENLGCGCDDGDSSVPPSSTTPSPSQLSSANTSPSAPPSSSSKPANAALGKGNDTPTPTPSPTTPTTPTSAPHKSSTSAPPAQTSSTGSGSGGDVHTGGQATFFTQNGNPGACGTVHQDSDLICALDSSLYSRSLCGKSVHITNTVTQDSVTVVVADECPTCLNYNSIDLSTGAFDQIGNQSTGVLQIKWEFV